MKKLIQSAEFDIKEKNTYIILLSAPVLLSIWWYFGRAVSFTKMFPEAVLKPNFDFTAHIFQFAMFFVLMFIVPVLTLKLIFKEKLSDYGFQRGDKKFGLSFVALAIPLIIAPIIYFAADMPDIRSEYPLAKILLTKHEFIFQYEILYVLFYYIAWEFFFRGFILFGVQKRFGSFNAILIQTISSCLIHIGKPAGETIGAIIVGILFGVIALRTRSIWYVLLLHAAIGVLTDLFVIFK
ncbi:MAG: type II CAAX endopeptidase family protein [Candidatus Kapabacteria bacterium]|nr:type II CAAX endopeptidase family protein [Candidatus Kapabacteria bacterium]